MRTPHVCAAILIGCGQSREWYVAGQMPMLWSVFLCVFAHQITYECPNLFNGIRTNRMVGDVNHQTRIHALGCVGAEQRPKPLPRLYDNRESHRVTQSVRCGLQSGHWV